MPLRLETIITKIDGVILKFPDGSIIDMSDGFPNVVFVDEDNNGNPVNENEWINLVGG